jgi:hypothetical protein
MCFSKSEFGSVSQVCETLKNHSVSPLSPHVAEEKGSRSLCFSKPEFGSVIQVDVPLFNHSVSPLSLWERVRVRGSSKLKPDASP